MYFKPAVATSLGQALYPCAISDEVCTVHSEMKHLIFEFGGRKYWDFVTHPTMSGYLYY